MGKEAGAEFPEDGNIVHCSNEVFSRKCSTFVCYHPMIKLFWKHGKKVLHFLISPLICNCIVVLCLSHAMWGLD